MNDDGQATAPDGTFKQVSAGGYHTCGGKAGGRPACWGDNRYGQANLRCADGGQDGTETDVDCGGDGCAPCADGAACVIGDDCESQVCADSSCQTATCSDGEMNGHEDGTDRGGPTCPPCDVAGMAGAGPGGYAGAPAVAGGTPGGWPG